MTGNETDFSETQCIYINFQNSLYKEGYGIEMVATF